jgi:hypothetical protein
MAWYLVKYRNNFTFTLQKKLERTQRQGFQKRSKIKTKRKKEFGKTSEVMAEFCL